MKKLLIPAIVSIAMLTSCEKKEAVNHSDHTQTEQTATAEADNHAEHNDATATLELDNGSKWKTNAEMLPFINEQEKLLTAYDAATGDFNKLGTDLMAANQGLVESCTMTGKSHDVLHVWLSEHMKKADLLAKSTDKTAADQLVNELKHSMETYHQYFE